MTPFVQILVDGRDVAPGIGSRLLSVTCHDEAEDKSDRVEIKLDNRRRASDGATNDVPLVGTTVRIVMGVVGSPGVDRGSYKIDALRAGSPPRELTVTGKSANMPSRFRTPRTQSYHQRTVGEIVEEIAKRNGFEPVIDPALDEIVVRHIDQNKESDMSFAARLAEQYDGVAKPVAGRLVVARRGAAQAATGEALPVVTVREADCIRWDFDYSARDEAGEASGLPSGGAESAEGGDGGAEVVDFTGGDVDRSTPATEGKGGVRAYWTDISTGKREKVEVGREPFHELRDTYHNEAEAQAAASAYRNKAARGKASFGCTIGARLDVQAEAKLVLVGFDPWIPTVWRIKSAQHSVASDAYTVRVSAEMFDEAQDKVADKVGGTKPARDDKIDKDAPEKPTKGRGKATGETTSDGATVIDFTKGIQ